VRRDFVRVILSPRDFVLRDCFMQPKLEVLTVHMGNKQSKTAREVKGFAFNSPAAPNVGLGDDTAKRLDKVEVNERKHWLLADVETSVAVQQRRGRAVLHEVLPMNDEHGDARSVLAAKKHLLRHEVVRLETFHFRGPEHLKTQNYSLET
jgi:hypothetical protein